jgi:hypothetical protein
MAPLLKSDCREVRRVRRRSASPLASEARSQAEAALSPQCRFRQIGGTVIIRSGAEHDLGGVTVMGKTRKMTRLLATLLAFGLMAGTALAAVNAVTPSTNDINRTNGWAHVNEVAGVGSVDLEFVSTREFYSCFEYRTDGDLTQSTGDNYNTGITDGLYPYTCENNSSTELTLNASEYVEVRMVFGAETDERFDWTRFDVLPVPEPGAKADCKSGGWETFGFRNQGQCVRFVETGKDSR